MANQSGKAFSLEIEPYLEKLYRAAFRLTQNRDGAEELVQDTCLRAFARRSSWAGTESPLGWLMRVQYNLFVDGTRKHRCAVVVALGDAEHPSLVAGKRFDPEACASDAEHLAQIHVACRSCERSKGACSRCVSRATRSRRSGE